MIALDGTAKVDRMPTNALNRAEMAVAFGRWCGFASGRLLEAREPPSKGCLQNRTVLTRTQPSRCKPSTLVSNAATNARIPPRSLRACIAIQPLPAC
jgi:hypothetical protein